jgi:hypothetical protein
MGPFTKNTLLRETSPKAAKAVPKVAISNVSKKPTSAIAKKQVVSKLGELGIKSMPSTASTAASNEAGSPEVIDIDSFSECNDYTPNSQAPPSSLNATLDSNFPPTFDSNLNSSVPEWVIDFQKQFRAHELRFEQQESRLHHLESLIQENAQLKETVAEQANLIAELQARLLAVPDQEIIEDSMVIDSTRDLSTNGSKWKTAPSTATTTTSPQTQINKPKKVVQAKPTFAQVTSKPVAQPGRAKRTPAKKVLSAAKLATVARPFVTNQEGASGFKYVYIGRSRKITRADTRSRFKLVGIDNSRILDINFPAHGVIGVLVHLQYVDKFASIMKKIGADLISDFDPLDPTNLADPKYESYTTEAREDAAFALQHTRCINALLFLQNSKPYQVKPVGYSLVELGFISVEDVMDCASSSPSDPKVKSTSGAGSLFTIPKGKGKLNVTESQDMEIEAVEDNHQQEVLDSDGEMLEVEERSESPL